MNNEVFSYSEFKKANEQRVSILDYLHAVFVSSSLRPDVAYSFQCIFHPTFVEIDGGLYLKELFDESKYQEYQAQKMPQNEIQLWMNLIEITGVFDGISIERALDFAESLSFVWNLQVDHRDGSAAGKARVIHEHEFGEVYVTID